MNVVAPVEDPSSLMSEFVKVWTAVQVFACARSRVKEPLVVIVPPDNPAPAEILETVPALAHCGVEPAPWVCKTCPVVPGARTAQTDAPR